MKTKIAKLVTLVSFAAILLMLSAVQAMACSCAGTKEPCQAYGEASAVFVGTVINIRTVAKKEDSYNRRAVRFQIDSDFRGAEGAEIEVLTGFGDADCGFRFTQSQQYLVYAYEYKGTLSTSICTRTRTLKTADDDLRYFSGLATAKPGAKISGKVVRYRRTDNGQLEEPLPGISILINGPQTLEVKSNAQGEYAIEGLTPGDYTVKVVLPAGMDAQGAAEQKALVIDHGCAVIDFWLTPEGNLSGLVIDPRGLPVNKAEIFLIESGKPRFRGHWDAAYTSEDGNYSFRRIPPGNYILSIRFDGMTSQQRPFPATFYPGVTDRSEAVIITIREGQRREHYDLTMPPLLLEYDVMGSVLWSDGKPAVGSRVEYSAHAESVTYTVIVDAGGKFNFKAYAGLRLHLAASVQKEPNQTVRSNSAQVIVGAGMERLKLVLPSP